MNSLRTLGLGKTLETKLQSIGIASAEDLRQTGSKEAALRLKMQYPGTCVVVLYHLEACLQGVEMKQLDSNTKTELKAFFAGL